MRALEEDGYPVENERLAKYCRGVGSQECHSFDMVWFVNKTKDQALVTALYADCHRTRSLHFNPENIPDAVLGSIGLNSRKNRAYRGWDLLPEAEKQGGTKYLLDAVEQMPSHYFVAKRGSAPGMSPDEARKNYGSPDTTEITPEGKLFSWDFNKENDLAEPDASMDSARVENSFGYHVKILFKNEKAIAILMASDVP